MLYKSESFRKEEKGCVIRLRIFRKAQLNPQSILSPFKTNPYWEVHESAPWPLTVSKCQRRITPYLVVIGQENKMDTLLKKLDTLQDLLRDLEDFLELQRDSEFVEFLSDYWKECLAGTVIAGFALYQGNSYLTVCYICLFHFCL